MRVFFFWELPVVLRQLCFIVSPETEKRNPAYSSGPHKRPPLFAEATKFNNLQFDCCNCLLLNASHTIVHRAGLQDCCNCRHNVHWTGNAWQLTLGSWAWRVGAHQTLQNKELQWHPSWKKKSQHVNQTINRFFTLTHPLTCKLPKLQ